MRNVTRRILWAAGAASLLLAAAACGDDDDDDASTDEGDSGSGGGGTLTVCSDTPYAPFEFEGDDGEQTGFDMELMREIASRLDREMEVNDLPFDGIVLAPESGQCDIVASAMSITPERSEQALFSDPYFDAEQSILVRVEDEDTYAKLENLAGKKIGVQTETTGATYAEENKPDGAEVVSFSDPEAMFLALSSGEVDALLQDLPVNGFRATQDDSFVVTETFPTDEQYGFLAAKDNTELIEQVNGALEEIREDGTYDEIYAEWFGEAPST